MTKLFDPQIGVPTKIPENAKKVFSGVVFDVYQWQQKLFDGSFATFEMIKRRNTCVVLAVTKEQRIVLIENQDPFTKNSYIGLPGGRAEVNESPIETAKRELQEETGYKSENFIPWFVFSSPAEKLEWREYFFVAKNCVSGKSGQKLDAGENIKLKFVSFEEFIELVAENKIIDTEIRETFAENVFDLKKEKIEEMRKMFFEI